MLKSRPIVRAVLSSVALLVALLGATTPSSAAEESNVQPRDRCHIWVEVVPGVFEYLNICDDPGEDDSGGGGGGSGPICDLSNEPYVEFCLAADMPCFADIPSPIAIENWPMEDRPSPNHIFTNVHCDDPDADEEYFDQEWIRPYRDALPDLYWDAYGQLQTPAFILRFTPEGMSYVGADTRFTIDGLGDGEIIGAEAGPLQATGTLSHVEIDPGDGTPVMECDPDLDTTPCEHVYLTMSNEEIAVDLEGRPSFTAQARLVYDVTFTINGVEQPGTPGVPATLESPWNGTVIPVGEIQALVQNR